MRAQVLLFIVASALACKTPPSNADGDSLATDDPHYCVQCHRDDYDGVSHPMHPGKKLTTCGVCHTQDSWHPTRLEHPWKLDGAHEKTDCLLCHNEEPNFRAPDKACISCHADKHDAANKKLAWHAAEGDSCQECHSTTAWKPPRDGYKEQPPHAPPTPSATPTTTPTVKPHPTVTPPRPTAVPTAKPHPTATATPTATTPPDPPPDPPIITRPSRVR